MPTIAHIIAFKIFDFENAKLWVIFNAIAFMTNPQTLALVQFNYEFEKR